MGMTFALPYVPQDSLVDAIGLIEVVASQIQDRNPPEPGALPLPNLVSLFANYVEITWVEEAGRPPLIPIEMWNWSDIFQNSTNKRVERFRCDLKYESSRQLQFFEFLRTLISRARVDLVNSSPYTNGATCRGRIGLHDSARMI